MERYEAYKDSGVEWIGEIPKRWDVTATKRYAKISNGSNPETEGDTPVYGSSGIAFKTCGEAKQAPAVLLGRKGTIESPSYIDHPYWNVDTAFDVKTREEVLKLRYYYYLANCFDYSRYQTSTAVPSMTQTDYGNIRIPIPSVIEQRAIADYLDAMTAEIDALVADCEREVGLLREYRKAVISEAVTKGLDPDTPMKDSGIEWIGTIPEEWNTDKTVRIFGTIGSGVTPKTDKAEYYDGEIPWVQSGDLGDWSINQTSKTLSQSALSDLPAMTFYKAPFIAVAMYGASIGSMSVVKVDACVNQACCVLSKCRGNQSYYAYAFSAAKAYLTDQGIGGTQPNISQKLIKALWLPCPPVRAQQSIVAYLDAKTGEIDSLIEIKQSMADKLCEYRRSLISEAVTGKFKVPGA